MLGNFFKEYFTFSRGERNGIIVLLFIIMILIALPYLLEFFRQQKEIDFSQFEKDIKEFEKQQAHAREMKVNKDTAAFEPFNFDPNELSEADWRKLGVSAKTARTIINYRSKGGFFDEKEDLLKIYGFDTAKYKTLEPYIVLAHNEENEEMDPFDKPVFRKKGEDKKQRSNEKFSYERKTESGVQENFVVELNSADTAALLKVKGIGPLLSRRIIKYREMLGGFVKVEQLMEVYGMDSLWFQTMKSSLTIDNGLVSKIAINAVTLEDLEKHPYFGRSVAKTIVNYRQQHGGFRSVDDLKKVYSIDEKLFAKIEPYILID